MFCTVQKDIFANIFYQISKVIKDRRKKRYNFPINISPISISLNVKFSIPTKILESCSHFLAYLINDLV